MIVVVVVGGAANETREERDFAQPSFAVWRTRHQAKFRWNARATGRQQKQQQPAGASLAVGPCAVWRRFPFRRFELLCSGATLRSQTTTHQRPKGTDQLPVFHQSTSSIAAKMLATRYAHILNWNLGSSLWMELTVACRYAGYYEPPTAGQSPTSPASTCEPSKSPPASPDTILGSER